MLLEPDDAVMQVLAAPAVPADLADGLPHDFEDEVSSVPIVDYDSSTERRPSPPPGREALDAPDAGSEIPVEIEEVAIAEDAGPAGPPGPEPIPGESTGDFSIRAEAIAKSAEARGRLTFEDSTAVYAEEEVLRALREPMPKEPTSDEHPLDDDPDDFDFDVPTRAYTADVAAELLAKAEAHQAAKLRASFEDDTAEEDVPADAPGAEPLEGEATRTDGSVD